MGGFLSGSFWGAIVGAVALFVSSQVLERQEMSLPQPTASEVAVPGGSEFDQARPESEPVLPSTEGRPEGTIETVEAPESEADEPPVLDTAALEVPEPTLEAPGGLGEAPEPETDVNTEPVATDEAVEEALREELQEPEVPGDAPEPEVADPVAPAGESEGTDTAGVAPLSEGEENPSGEDTQVAALPASEPETEQPETENAPAVSTQDTTPSLVQPEVTEDSALPDSSGGGDVVVDESPAAPRLPQISDEPSLPEGDDAPAIAAAPSEGAATIRVDDGPSLLEPVEDLEDRAEGVETDRLPQAGESSLPGVRRVGDATEPEVAEVEAEGEGEVMEADGASGPALTAFASAFDNPEGRPIVALVLLQQGSTPLSDAVLDGLPAHVGFAIDAGAENAAEIAAAYRQKGREVVMIPSLPQGATPQDVEQAMQVNLATLPEAVAVMDVSGSSFQSDRAAVQQVVNVVADTGHGMITFPRGLNAAHQEAQRAGVPTGLIFRNIDGDGETQEQIRRALDRAAFRARQDEGVILVGTTAEVTLSAVVEWALGNRAASVTIAPVSAALSSDG